MIRKDVLGKKLNNKTFIINTSTKEVGYIIEDNRIRCLSLLDKVDHYRTYDKIVEDFSEWCGIRADSVTIKQYECLKYNVWLDKKDDRKRRSRDNLTHKLYRKYDRIANSAKIKNALEYMINHKEFIVTEDELKEHLNISDPFTVIQHLASDQIASFRTYIKANRWTTYYFLSKNKEKALELLK